MQYLRQRQGKTRPFPEAKTPTLIRMMMARMIIREGALFVLVKVRDKKEKRAIFQEQQRGAARRMKKGGWTQVCKCVSVHLSKKCLISRE